MSDVGSCPFSSQGETTRVYLQKLQDKLQKRKSSSVDKMAVWQFPGSIEPTKAIS